MFSGLSWLCGRALRDASASKEHHTPKYQWFPLFSLLIRILRGDGDGGGEWVAVGGFWLIGMQSGHIHTDV